MEAQTDELDRHQELLGAMRAVASRLEDLLQLQRFALLEDGHIFRFLYEDREVALSIPFAQRDFIQRNILKGGTFYEIKLLEALRVRQVVKPGGVIYDVGANIGNHSVYFSKVFCAERLISVEPQQSARRILEENVRLNELKNCTVLNCLLGAEDGSGTMVSFGDTNLGATSFKGDAGGDVNMQTLDGIVAEHSDGLVDFVKIDVEGMHLEVLAGARNVLSGPKPTIWIELREFKNEYDEAAEALAGYGYKQVFKLGPHDYLFAPA